MCVAAFCSAQTKHEEVKSPDKIKTTTATKVLLQFIWPVCIFCSVCVLWPLRHALSRNPLVHVLVETLVMFISIVILLV